jgi:tRNA(Ile)-lysidine synthase
VLKERPEGLVLDIKAFALLHPALKRHLLRAGLEHLTGNLVDIEAVHIESMIEIIAKPAGKTLSLPGGLVLSTEYGQALVGPQGERCPLPTLAGEHRLTIPGETLLSGWRVRASISHQPISDTGQAWSADLDLDRTGNELLVRSRRPGDRFQPLGMSQIKKLQDFMVDAKIPRAWRERVPLVCSPGQILWVVGWRLDERVRVTDSTQQVLHLEFEKVGTE